MQHSVLCRSQEIQAWVGLGLDETIRRLEQERQEFLEHVVAAGLPRWAEDGALRNTMHLQKWINALLLDQRVNQTRTASRSRFRQLLSGLLSRPCLTVVFPNKW